jgi:CDP-6-deoxy-D-xylo-4-hexulose-3-dehydrase
MTVREGVERERVVRHLEEKGVQTRMLFSGNLLRHPCFDQLRGSGQGYRVAGSLENTDRIMRDSFWVGVYPGMTDDMLGFMTETILEAVR